MSNSIYIPTGYKRCSKGVDCKHEDGPILPIDQFYKLNRGKRIDTYCKVCRKSVNAENETRYTRTKKTTSEYSDSIAIDKLNSLGIYTTPGKASMFDWVDAVAWGCVRIEVKLARLGQEGRYVFSFSSQKDIGIQADLVMLIPVNGDKMTFHLFPADHPVFYTLTGLSKGLKDSLEYIPNAHHRTRVHSNKIILTKSLMDEYENAWHLIEQKRAGVQQALLNGTFDPQRTTKPAILPMSTLL